MRTINEAFLTVKPFATVLPACPMTSAVPAPGTLAVASRPAVAAPLWSAALARPKSGVVGTGVAYAAGALGAAIVSRRGIDRDVPNGTANGERFIGTNGNKQQDQLHLMSRRDPRTWRPPA